MIISKTYIDHLCFTPDGEYGTWVNCIFTIKNIRRAFCYKSDYDNFNEIIKELRYYVQEYEDDQLDKE